ncbi:MAG: aspartyl/asparaginyl beta-hydroxylase domain-containing protein [Streptosporangiaceae bacterium]
MIPAATQLTPTFDPARLQTDLTALTGHAWEQQQVSDYSGLGARTDLDWRVLPLRSLGGDPDRTDPGGPGPEDFAPTRWLARVPYLAEVLAALPGPVNAARLMALGPGATSHLHADPKYALTRGFVRLHIPITTNPSAVLLLDGVTHRWQPGQLWCGQFSRPHQVRNDGDLTRVHLVIDVLVSTGLADLFPADRRPGLQAEALFNRPERPDATPVSADLYLPTAFTDFTRDDVLGTPEEPTPAHFTAEGGRGRLSLLDGRVFALVHLGSGEFRFAGWSEQRTLQIRGGEVVLRTRDGRTVRELSISPKDLRCS